MAGLVELRAVEDVDLSVFFSHQQDAEAVHMAAFVSKDPSDRAAFDTHWERIRAHPSVAIRTILRDGRIAGHVASFEQEGTREVTYWIGRDHTGRGVATAALKAFLECDDTRPMHARVAKDNRGSIRVLEKCGFETVGEERGFANARGEEIDELVMRLA